MVQSQEFVRLVRLLNVARTADHGRNRGDFLKQPGFGAIGDLGMVVPAGKLAGQVYHLVVRIDLQAGNLADRFDAEAGGKVNGLQFRLQLFLNKLH